MTVAGEILRFNLDRETYDFVNWMEEDRDRYDAVSLRRMMGGIGFGFEELLDRQPCSDPSGRFVINTGFLTGLPKNGVPSGCTRTYIEFNSPIKEKDGRFGIAYAAAGGLCGPHIKSCGIDGVVLEGSASEPVGVMIDASSDKREVQLVELDPELSTFETIDFCFERGFRGSLAVGPAGFRGVRFSSIHVSYMPHDHVRAAARGGPGLVLAGMNVKAVAFSGSPDRFPKPGQLKDGFSDWLKGLNRELSSGSSTEKYKRHGTWGGNWAYLVPLRALPAENFRRFDSDQSHLLDPEYLVSKGWSISRKGCACPIMCWKIPKDPSGKTLWKMDYENVDLLGPNLGIYDIYTLSQAIKSCDEMGLDAMSTGGVIAWFFEHNERRGKGPTFGDGEAVLDLIRKIARKEGIGSILSQGVKKASRELGDSDIAMQVKGLEGAAYPFWSNLGYAFALRGACHTSMATYTVGISNPDKVAEATWWAEQIYGAIPISMISQMSGACYFTRRVIVPELPRLVENLLGVRTTREEIERAAYQSYVLARMMDGLNGFSKEDDWLPPRAFRYGTTEELLDQTRSLFYQKMGFDEDGRVTRDTLSNFGMNEYSSYVS